ncbi:MAG: hypothetical protein KF729_25335 [Sandaracinaceae bacterium]|nr:hypothetical protein [Sandaracinaceae bacterium]
MPRSMPMAMAAGGPALVVGSLRAPSVLPADAHALEAPSSIAALRAALAATPLAQYDAAWITGWGRELAPVELAREVAVAVRPGGAVAFVAPEAAPGWRGASAAVRALFGRARPVPLEALCGALLLAGLVDVRALALDAPRGHVLVRATVPEPWPDDVESSSIRASRGEG